MLAKPPRPSGDWALFLDFDGTLVDIASTPDSVSVDSALPDILAQLSRRFGGAVAVVSGRALSDVDRFLNGAPVAGAGLHGVEVRGRPGAPVRREEVDAAVDRVRKRLGPFLGAHEGVMLEDKGATLAVHYRARPELEREARAAVAEAMAGTDRLHAIDGKMVVEVKPRGIDKGHAVRRLMELPPFRGRTPVFVGDDVTDEDGFTAAEALGGFGVKVGTGETAARYALADAAGVREWLAASSERADAL